MACSYLIVPRPPRGFAFYGLMLQGDIELSNGRVFFSVDYADPSKTMFLTIDEDIANQSVTALLTHEQAEELAIALIEICREGKKRG